jgi:DNA-binding NarL/FixJ family response regulator
MAEGKSNLGIAEALEVTLAAVEKHVGRIFAKLGLGNEPLEHRRVLAVLTLLRAN